MRASMQRWKGAQLAVPVREAAQWGASWGREEDGMKSPSGHGGAPSGAPRGARAATAVLEREPAVPHEDPVGSLDVGALRAALDGVLREARDGLAVLSRDGRVLRANLAFARMLDETEAKEVEGRGLTECLPGLSLDAEVGAPGAGKARPSHRLDATFRRSDGTLTALELQLSPCGDAHWIAHLHQVSSRAPEPLAPTTPPDVVFEALAWAHDVNNMLAVIDACAISLRLLVPERSDVVEELDELRGAASKAAQLTRRMLGGQQGAATARAGTPVNEVIGDLCSSLRRSMPERVSLCTRLAPELWPVALDRLRIAQVVTNLIVNARDAIVDRGIIEVSTRNCGAGLDGTRGAREGEVEIAVSDTGCGMPPETLAHIFDDFFTTKGPGRGSGIGLATVRRIVERAGGRLSVSSEEGRGSTFRVRFPAAARSEPAPP